MKLPARVYSCVPVPLELVETTKKPLPEIDRSVGEEVWVGRPCVVTSWPITAATPAEALPTRPRTVEEGFEVGGFVLVADGVDVGDVGRGGGQRGAVGGKAGDADVQGSIQTHFTFPCRGLWSFRPSPLEGWRRFCGPVLVSKLQNQLLTAAMSLGLTSMLPMTSIGDAAGHVDLADGAGAGDRGGDRVAGWSVAVTVSL